ncbi:hypothetical protein H5410_056687 [Solanum commersonii]|uniref:Uncharacterized protein n=1 Tax=Solanum commersonii TaxID=4109 RepID=A0A9J5WKX5_SOLCO|nr:hypothetical protein H5410_056687 [Solanum commersonii]
MEQCRLLTVLTGPCWLSGLLPSGVGLIIRSYWILSLRLDSLPRRRKMEGEQKWLVPAGSGATASPSEKKREKRGGGTSRRWSCRQLTEKIREGLSGARERGEEE